MRLYSKLFPRKECAHDSCDFSGAYQPPLTETFYGFSYMYDRTTAIGLLDGVPKVFGEQAISRRSRADLARSSRDLAPTSRVSRA